MSPHLRDVEAYLSGLTKYIRSPAEENRVQGYEWGRKATLNGIGPLTVVAIHKAALTEFLAKLKGSEVIQELVQKAEEYLTECLGAYEIAFRSFRDANVELRRTNAALEDAIRTRDEFLSIASHELKTPLTPLKLYLDSASKSLKEEKFREELRSDLLKSVQLSVKSLERISHLIEQLLDVSRVRTGRLELKPEECNLSSLINLIVKHYEVPLKNANCSITLELDPLINGFWDPLRIEQVLANLITNAIKYASGYPIKISTQAQGDWVILKVEDHGPGISKKDQLRIFQRFERATSSRNYGGLGLGLYISRQIVETHGGSISVESEPGKGALFIVKLPLKVTATFKQIA